MNDFLFPHFALVLGGAVHAAGGLEAFANIGAHFRIVSDASEAAGTSISQKQVFMHPQRPEPIDILLVEDSAGDVRLTREALGEARVRTRLHIVEDGVEAMDFLLHRGPYAVSRPPRPDIILLDLNLPKMDGRQVLAAIKNHPTLKLIPVVVLTTSEAEADVRETYGLHANCYLVKPVDVGAFFEQVRSLEGFWLTAVKLPPSLAWSAAA